MRCCAVAAPMHESAAAAGTMHHLARFKGGGMRKGHVVMRVMVVVQIILMGLGTYVLHTRPGIYPYTQPYSISPHIALAIIQVGSTLISATILFLLHPESMERPAETKTLALLLLFSSILLTIGLFSSALLWRVPLYSLLDISSLPPPFAPPPPLSGNSSSSPYSASLSYLPRSPPSSLPDIGLTPPSRSLVLSLPPEAESIHILNVELGGAGALNDALMEATYGPGSGAFSLNKLAWSVYVYDASLWQAGYERTALWELLGHRSGRLWSIEPMVGNSESDRRLQDVTIPLRLLRPVCSPSCTLVVVAEPYVGLRGSSSSASLASSSTCGHGPSNVVLDPWPLVLLPLPRHHDDAYLDVRVSFLCLYDVGQATVVCT